MTAFAPRDAEGRRITYQAVDRADAEAWLDATVLRRAQADGRAPETVRDYLVRWLDRTYRHAPTSTATAYRHAAAWIIRVIGDVRVDDLTSAHADLVTDAMLDAGLSARYARQVRGLMGSAFKGRLAVGPYRRPLKSPKRRQAVWSADQAATFLKVARRSRWGPLWTLALSYGLRKGELRALQWGDLEGLTLWIRRNLRHDNSEGDTKAHVERSVRLSRPVLAELGDFRGSVHSDVNWMFAVRGRPPSADALARELAALTPPELPRLTLHGLRHSCATILLRRGVPIAKVSQLLGHHNPGFTLSQYGWCLPDDEALVDAAIEGFFD